MGGTFVEEKKNQSVFHSAVLTSTDKSGASRSSPKSGYPQADPPRRRWPRQDVSMSVRAPEGGAG